MYACVKPMFIEFAENKEVFSEEEKLGFQILNLGDDFIYPTEKRPVFNGKTIDWIDYAQESMPITTEMLIKNSIEQV